METKRFRTGQTVMLRKADGSFDADHTGVITAVLRRVLNVTLSSTSPVITGLFVREDVRVIP